MNTEALANITTTPFHHHSVPEFYFKCCGSAAHTRISRPSTEFLICPSTHLSLWLADKCHVTPQSVWLASLCSAVPEQTSLWYWFLSVCNSLGQHTQSLSTQITHTYIHTPLPSAITKQSYRHAEKYGLVLFWQRPRSTIHTLQSAQRVWITVVYHCLSH